MQLDFEHTEASCFQPDIFWFPQYLNYRGAYGSSLKRIIYLFICFILNRVSLYSPDWSGTLSVEYHVACVFARPDLSDTGTTGVDFSVFEVWGLGMFTEELASAHTTACLLAGSSRGRGRARSLSYFYNLTITSSKPNISQTPHLQIPSRGRYDSNIWAARGLIQSTEKFNFIVFHIIDQAWKKKRLWKP